MIELRNVTTGYIKTKPLLVDYSKQFDEKIYGILGHSGCGKTTLLRTIAGLVKPLAGEVYVNGKLVKDAGSTDAYMMHQNYTCFDWKRCLDNVLMAKSIKSPVTIEDRRAAIDILDRVGLGETIYKYPKQISGGQRQRLALARTIFVQPSVILMDEPLSALDGDTRIIMQDLILQLHRETHNTIILVTHSEKEAQRMCDEIIDL